MVVLEMFGTQVETCLYMTDKIIIIWSEMIRHRLAQTHSQWLFYFNNKQSKFSQLKYNQVKIF